MVNLLDMKFQNNSQLGNNGEYPTVNMYKVNTHSRPRKIESYRNTLRSLYYMIKERASSHITSLINAYNKITA